MLEVKQKITAGVILLFIGWGAAKLETPAGNLWIDLFGSAEDRALKGYTSKQIQSQRDSLAQVALDWQRQQDSIALEEKIRRDSLAQVTRIEALACLQREINKSEENICQSTLYYYRGIRAKGTNWFIRSTRCLDRFMIPAGLYGNFPLVLLDSRWVKRRFPYRSSVSAREVAYALGICKSE